MIEFDPSEYIRGLQQLLISDKKKIAFLCGAGTSLSHKQSSSICVPAVQDMTNKVEANITAEDKYKDAIQEIKAEIGEAHYNVEALLTNIEEKRNVIGNGILNGLCKDDFDRLDSIIKNKIRELVSVHDLITSDEEKSGLIHSDFAEWICQADRKYPVEIFTTNYDYLFEIGLEYKCVPYYDGFTGSFEPFFNADSVEDLNFMPQQTKLWKIHGSLGWHINESNKKVLRRSSDKNDILIYPSVLKYANSKKQPYVSLMDRLTNFIKQPDSVLFVCGYSFGDEHINERIMTALNSNTTAHVYVLYFDMIREDKKRQYALKEDCYLSKLAKENSKLSVFAYRNAVIGCQYGTWRLKREPDKDDTIQTSLYFDEDAPIDTDAKIGEERKDNLKWTGLGEFILPDFDRFVSFLKSMIS